MDKLVPDQSDMFKYGQTVVAKVIEVDKEKKRFLASLRMLDCYHGDTGVGIDILEHHLGEQRRLQNMLTDKGTDIFFLSFYQRFMITYYSVVIRLK